MVDASSVVYVIDDDASVREAIESLLRSVGLYAEVFPSTADFMSTTRREIPSCLVLDVRLPGVSGLEFQEELERSGIHVPIVFITAHGDIPMATRALKAGAMDFLPKPFGKNELLAAVHAALDRDRARRTPPSTGTPDADMGLLSRIAGKISAATPLQEVLDEVVGLVAAVVACDACFVYVVEEDELVLRASKTPHPESVDLPRLKSGEGIIGWMAECTKPVVVTRNASRDSRLKMFDKLPEDTFEAFLSVPVVSGGKVVGVINVQNRDEHQYSPREISIIATVGYLVGAEIERVRLEEQNTALADRLETRKIVERAKGILQRQLKIDESQAYRTLQRESQQRRKSMKDIAEAVILSDELTRKLPNA